MRGLVGVSRSIYTFGIFNRFLEDSVYSSVYKTLHKQGLEDSWVPFPRICSEIFTQFKMSMKTSHWDLPVQFSTDFVSSITGKEVSALASDFVSMNG